MLITNTSLPPDRLKAGQIEKGEREILRRYENEH